MKTKISHLGRSSVSVILAVMMLLSTMLIGTVSTVNATVNDAIKVYFDKSSCSDNGNTSTDGWTNIYAYAYDNKGDVKTYTNSADVTGKGSWPGQAMYDEGNNIYSILVEPTATSIIFNNNDNSNKKQTGNITLPAEDTLNWKTTSVIYKNNTWVSYSASVDTTGVVTDTRLVSVLDGSKVMFYGGEYVEWKQDYFVAMNTKDTNDVADSAKTDYEKQLTKKDSTSASTFKFGILCVPAGTYYMGHKGWAPNLKANVVAGDAFVIYNSEINDFKQVAKDGNNLLLQSVSTGTKTATTTLSATKVATGDLLGVTTSTPAGNSSLGFDNTFEYYVHNKTTNKFYKVTLSDGKLNTSAFTEEGEYEVKTVLKDTNGLYVLADSDNFVISNKAKYSVTFGSNDTNMGKVSVSDGTVSYTTSPASVEEGKSVTFTATAENGYKFDGWYSDADCTKPIDGASSNTYTVDSISNDVSAYAKFSAVSYNITKEDVTNYSVEVKESAEYNSQVSVTVTATNDAYEVDGITITDKDNKVVNVNGGESGVYTFTMPASNVSVKANSKLKQIDAPTVKFNVVGQSTADAKVLGSTPITASYTAAENSTIVEGSENVAVTDANGTTVSADKYSLVKNTTTGDYTFTAKEPGTYKLSYTVTAKSNYDENMTATNSPVSVTVTVAYTATQQAYVDLQTYVSSVQNTSAGSYTEDSYVAFSTALKSAQALLKGLPKADATNVSDYTNAKTALEAAFNGLEKDVTYYISGRFENHGWNTDAIDMPFTRVSGESNLYKYETHKSVADLSKQIHDVLGNYDANQYFFITTGKGLKGTFYTGSSKNGNNFHENTVAKKLTLTTHTNNDSATANTDNLIVFNDISDSSPNVVIYLDTSDKDNLKLYYSTEKYSVTVAEGVPASVDKTEFAKGETVTVKATPETGKVLDKVTVVGEDGSTPIETTVSGNTATFKMPAQNVTVKDVKFREAKTCTVTFRSSDDKSGTVSAMKGTTLLKSPATVTEGDEVTFTAEPKSGYALSGWTVNNASVSPTTNPYTITVQKDTTVVANFKVEDSGTPSGFYILWGKDAKFSEYKAKELYLKDGKYYANFDAATDKIGTNENCYFVFSTSNTTNGVTAEETNVTVNKVAQNNFYFESNNSDISGVGNTRVPKIWNENADLLGFKIIVSDIDSSNKKVTYSCEPTFDVAPADTVEITAKDGTIRAGFTNTGDKKTTAVLGDTTLSITTPADKIITASDSQKIDGKNRAVTAKKVPNGSTVTVTTTIDPDATFAGHKGSDYYVKGFSVNGIFGGVLSQTDGKNHTSYEYTYTFEVNQEIYGSKLEITPVYFLKDDANCVYFYIENYDSAKQIWGNTPSCYVYYGSGTTTLEALGYYPGQPMVDYNGSIFTQIPKSIDNGGTRVDITGMTLNNYVWDDVHKDYNGKNQKEDNAQTYDYDDFVKIAESSVAPDNIIYRFKYNEFKNEPKATLEASKADPNGWEVFLDYQNYPTDIFGNRIGNDKLDYKDTDSVTNKDNYLSIISDGYQNNYIGKYATAWSIYNKAGERVATIPSSALLYALGKSDEQMTTAIGSKSTPTDFLPGKKDRDTYWKTFKTLYNDYKGFYAQINFEAAIKGGDEKGNRLDGRWYYTKSQQEITGEIKIQYANTLDDYKVGNFHDDTFADDEPSSIEGTTTGASAYFTDPKDKVRKLVTEADNTQDYKFIVNATSTATYTFVGWYRLIDGDYKAINPSDMSSLTGAVTRNSDVTLVARYIKTPGGSMTFHHSLYNGENAGGGKATTEIQVVVKDSKGKSLYDSGKIPGTASIDKTKIIELAAQPDLTVTVTLYTTTKNLYNFKGYYSAENTTDITAFNPATGFTTNVSGNRTEGLVTTSEYKFSFNDYYAKYANILTAADAGTVYYNFYSDITSIKVPYKVQFSYTDRMGEQKYYNKAGYVDPENTSSYTFDENATNGEGVESHSVKVTLTDSFILSLAPYESNFTKNLTWDKPTDSMPFDSSVSKSIASAVVKSTQSGRTIHLNVFRDNNGVPTPRTNIDGAFELFTRNNSPELPYGSVFYTSNGDGTYKYEINAPKTYKDKQFMYWAIYSDSECENLVIKAYNSEGNFSYVAYDNCWIVPVYGESSTPVASVKDVYTSTQFMEVTRNQWTAKTDSAFAGFDADSMNTLDTNKDFIKGNDEDKLYADFVLNFFYNGKQLSVFDPDSSKVQTGIVMQKLELEKDSIGVGYNTDMKYYANKYTADLSAAAEDAKNKILTGKSSIESLTKQINNDRLDNKNRLQYYARFNNTEANANCVYRVYTYIKYVNESNDTVVELGKPIYFTLYDVANATV